jgi:hypothetical protein
MPERIGFDRKIRLNWLDLAAGAVRDTKDATVVNATLNRSLATEVSGSQARRKTINVLTRIWLRVPEAHQSLRDEALVLWVNVTEPERVWLHWGLALLAYPFFRDVVATAGRLIRLQEEFTLAQVHRAVVSRWGERATLKYAVPRVLYSLSDWKILTHLDQQEGRYTIVGKCESGIPEMALWLLEAALRTYPADALPLYDLQRLPELFPFALAVGSGEIHSSARFLIVQEAGNTELVTLRQG